MTIPFPEPTVPAESRADVLLGYLDYFRSVVVDKVRDLPVRELTTSRLPSGWTPLGLLSHLRHMERRWVVWGFAGEAVTDPWGDGEHGRWVVAEQDGLAELVEALHTQAARTREIVLAKDLSVRGRPGPRWPDTDPPTLERVLLHVFQEYARHAGQLDVVREMIDGRTGE